MNIAIIGAGISGIAAAGILNRAGHTAVLFEKSARAGGVWAVSYPGVSLQNSVHQYALAEFPWPFEPGLHPTGAEMTRYLDLAVKELNLNVRYNAEVTALAETPRGWKVKYRDENGEGEQEFDYVVSAIGQYTEGKHRPRFPGADAFKGEIITERDITSLDMFKGRQVMVAGFGKSALDIASMAAAAAAQVHHAFRTPRWMIPFSIFHIHYTRLLFCRLSTFLMPCWDHPTGLERWVHRRLGFLVNAFWYAVARLFSLQARRCGLFKGAAANERLSAVIPTHPLTGDLRSAAALAPREYLPRVADGRILPHRGEIAEFAENAVRLRDGRTIPCDLAVLCVGSETPRFPFLPDKYRRLLESGDDGPQLYRHVLHPGIPRFACAGYNHGFMHVSAAEAGVVWLCAYLDGDLQLPPPEEMLRRMDVIQSWKREHINYEPSRSCAVSTRFQQYLDAMLMELGVSPYRKLPNLFAELFVRYGAADYRGVFDEYMKHRQQRDQPLQSLPRST